MSSVDNLKGMSLEDERRIIEANKGEKMCGEVKETVYKPALDFTKNLRYLTNYRGNFAPMISLRSKLRRAGWKALTEEEWARVNTQRTRINGSRRKAMEKRKIDSAYKRLRLKPGILKGKPKELGTVKSRKRAEELKE